MKERSGIMRSEDIFEAMGNIDEKVIAECDSYSAKKAAVSIKGKWITAAAACVCIAAAATAFVMLNGKTPQTEKTAGNADLSTSDTSTQEYGGKDSSYELIATEEGAGMSSETASEDHSPDVEKSSNTSQKNSDDSEEYEVDTALVEHWEDMTITEQYSNFQFDSNEYFVSDEPLDSSTQVGESLGSITVEGYDYYTEETHRINAELFAVNNMSDNFAAAIKYEGTEEYYFCENSDYVPQDIESFLADTDLKNLITIKNVSHFYSLEDEEMFITDTYEISDSGKFFDILFSDIGGVRSEHKEEFYWDYELDIDSDLLRGTIGFAEDGYINTNIAMTGASFYVGADKINAIVQYLEQNCSKSTEEEPFYDDAQYDIDEAPSSANTSAYTPE